MGPHMYYLYEKAREARCQDLRHEMEKRQLLAQLPRRRRSLRRYTAGKLGVLLLKPGMWLKKFEQTHTAFED